VVTGVKAEMITEPLFSKVVQVDLVAKGREAAGRRCWEEYGISPCDAPGKSFPPPEVTIPFTGYS
jgi:hypothetical protein